MSLLLGEMPDNTVTLLLRVQDVVCGKLAWEADGFFGYMLVESKDSRRENTELLLQDLC